MAATTAGLATETEIFRKNLPAADVSTTSVPGSIKHWQAMVEIHSETVG